MMLKNIRQNSKFTSVKACFFLLLMLAALVCLQACSSTRQSHFYQLEETSNSSLMGVEKGSIIGIGPVQLAEYINRPQIITRTTVHHLQISEFHRWIEPLGDSINRMLVVSLSNNLNSNRVYWLPRKNREYPLDLRVAIDIGRFDGQLDGLVSLESRWSIFDAKDKPLLTKVSLIELKVEGKEYDDLVITMNKVLQKLGKEISTAAEPFVQRSQ